MSQHPPHHVEQAHLAQSWLARGAAIRVGGKDISGVVAVGAEAILAPGNEQRALEQGLIVHLRVGDNSGVYRAYERGWHDGRAFKGEPACKTCSDTQRVKTLTSGWVRCPGCAPLVHMREETDHVRCSIDSPDQYTSEETDVTCPDCLHEMLQPSDAEMRAARWIGRAIAYLRASADGGTIHDVNRAELLTDADAIWKGEDPDEWDKAVMHAAGRARCVCGRTKDELMTAGHAPGCTFEDQAPEDSVDG